jgi:hypothetical protein
MEPTHNCQNIGRYRTRPHLRRRRVEPGIGTGNISRRRLSRNTGHRGPYHAGLHQRARQPTLNELLSGKAGARRILATVCRITIRSSSLDRGHSASI